jgi:hypothetical protein
VVSADEVAKRPLHTVFLLGMHADLDPPQELGRTPYGQRKIYNVRGGRFDGPRLRGKILPGGGEWLIQRNDDTSVLDVRVTFQTDDGALIYVDYRGLVYLPPAALAKWEAGKSMQWSEYYFRVAPFFETSAEKYLWLNNMMAVGVGEFTTSSVDYTVYEIR